MNTPKLDLMISAGRVVSPAENRDGPGVVGVVGDRIVDVPESPMFPSRAISLPDGAILLPGLIDMHAHPARGGSRWGIDPDQELLEQGTTTVLSQGDSGASNWQDYFAETVLKSRTRVRLAFNIAACGESRPGGCCADLDDVDVDAAIKAIRKAGDVREPKDSGRKNFVWGIAVNASPHACGQNDPREVVRRALIVAEETGLPLLYGPRTGADWPFETQFAQLRPGDVVTYCYRRQPYTLIENGDVHPAWREARTRGVLFDVGHGRGSFDFETAERAIALGFPPDTISTDYQAGHIGQQPRHSLPRTLSKLLAAGMSEAVAFGAVTRTPATVLHMEGEIGTLAPGSCADLTALVWNPQPAPLEDVNGNTREGGCWETTLVVRGGEVHFQGSDV